MGVADLRLQLHEIIDAIADKEKLEAVFTLLKNTKGPFQPMSSKEYVGQIDEAINQVNEGKYSSTDDLEKESENW
jgi:hypothetical protein